MKENIDCLFIGYNEMSFPEYEKAIRSTGTNSSAYRDLNLSFLTYNNQPFTFAGMFNLIGGSGNDSKRPLKNLSISETFSAAIAYLGTYLSRRGYTFEYVNAFQDEKEILIEMLTGKNILAIAITTTFYFSSLPILEIMDFVRKYNNDAKIIIGGPFVSNQVRTKEPENLMYLFNSLGADFYVNSAQGEAALVKIIDSLKSHVNPTGINNIYYKLPRGYAATPVEREDNKISQNMVDWSLFGHRVGEYALLRTSISCPFSCAFCAYPAHAGKYQTADVEAVEKELNTLAKIKSVKKVNFIDDTFNVPVDRFKNTLRMFIKNKYNFNWHSFFRCQFADREMVELMKESGCEGVFLGIESGNDQILKNMNKVAAVEKYLKGIELLKEYEIITFGSFIIGFPGETDETVKDTIQLIEESGLDFYRTQPWYCDPISPIYKQKDKYKIKGEGVVWSHATMNSARTCDLIEELFLSVKKSVWLPFYDGDYGNLFHLLARGITLAQVKDLFKSFNNGIKEKLLAPSAKEVSPDVMMQFHRSLAGSPGFESEGENVIGTSGTREQENDLVIDFDL
ncbi:MAG: PhpK family radical SAM P-methyltransferase [Candidatus Aminicenantes bacterium]|nr:PhpK family radical SAM P-methyltransferase [Candidatus Aminicenantes bacterium]NIM83449.1 PhpK family radical SAM P-methyltransferase [Candidatus Aminicenantes bacterium]NIN22841.1 PhpK family radical SAM P-methyltransferase [Candidatus Aminicenantes bacterium]NIN46577.1 PhpK family radical SAM P-methyltransferase [Candidatus Aminicenantes bacterium]NIN89480.1 PhpK family radical SAM P-methyltransferase [Candidatus Aminicenantes bacterium]